MREEKTSRFSKVNQQRLDFWEENGVTKQVLKNRSFSHITKLPMQNNCSQCIKIHNTKNKKVYQKFVACFCFVVYIIDLMSAEVLLNCIWIIASNWQGAISNFSEIRQDLPGSIPILFPWNIIVAEIRLTYGFWEKKWSNMSCHVIFDTA